jgi:hypothetical protein
MLAYLRELEKSTRSVERAAPQALHVRLRDYMAALPEHRRVRPFCLEQLCEQFDAQPAAMADALRRCGLLRHERNYLKLRWVFWMHWSSPHRF